MSKEIKFRAWSEPYKQWCGGTNYIDGVWLGWICRYGKDIMTQDIILEQYTGLKDKNGIEIYEGDIIRETISEDGITDGTYVYEVYWDEDLLIWSLNSISDIYHMRNDLWETNASREVIGNIHENPELLGGEE